MPAEPGVFGYDTRELVPTSFIQQPASSTNGPFGAIGLIQYAGVGSGTGFLIGPNLFLTAAHVVYGSTGPVDQGGSVVYDAEVNPGALTITLGEQGGHALAVAKAKAVFVPTGWKNDNAAGANPSTEKNIPDDYALIVLDGNYGDSATGGWFSFPTQQPFSSDQLTGALLSSAGYPGDVPGIDTTSPWGPYPYAPKGTSMYVTYGPSNNASDSEIDFAPQDYSQFPNIYSFYPYPPGTTLLQQIQDISQWGHITGIDAYHGQSGSPVWVDLLNSDGQVAHQVVGIKVAGDADDDEATLINPDMIAAIAFCTAGTNMAASVAMMAITTSSSISVKPLRLPGGIWIMGRTLVVNRKKPADVVGRRTNRNPRRATAKSDQTLGKCDARLRRRGFLFQRIGVVEK